MRTWLREKYGEFQARRLCRLAAKTDSRMLMRESWQEASKWLSWARGQREQHGIGAWSLKVWGYRNIP